MQSLDLSEKEERVFLGLERSYSWSNRLEHALSFIKITNNAKLIDIGAGKLAWYGKQNYGNRYYCLDYGDSYTISKDDAAVLDKTCDFEKENLPYSDNQFEIVICLDVLEHLDNPHKLLSELFRISSDIVVVSLPNNWVGFLKSLLIGQNITHQAGYGLYPNPHPAGQRHKYWFNYSEARNFLLMQTPNNYSAKNIIPRFAIMEDSLIPSFSPRIISKYFSDFISSCSTFIYSKEIRDKGMQNKKYLLKVMLGMPLFLLDYILSRAVYGLRSKLSWFNMVCRGIVVIYKKDR